MGRRLRTQDSQSLTLRTKRVEDSEPKIPGFNIGDQAGRRLRTQDPRV